MTNNEILYILRAKNDARRASKQFSDDMRASGRSVKEVGDQAQKARKSTDQLGASAKRSARDFGLLKKAAAGLGTAVGAAVAAFLSFQTISAAISTAREFNAALAETSTLIEGTPAQLDQLRNSTRDLAAEYGVSATEQVKAFYQAISAGAANLDDANSLVVQANKLATGGVTDVTTSVDILTTAVNAYGKDALNAQQASDALFVGMKAGKTTIGELASELGTVIPLAKAAGVSFDEITAATAALTTQGVRTNTATTQLKALLSGVIKAGAKDGSEFAKAAKEMGIEFNIAGLQAKGLKGFLDDLIEKTGGSADQIGRLFESVEAVNAVLSLSGVGAQKFSDVMEDMRQKAGATDEAFQKVAQNLDNRMKAALASMVVSLEKLGQIALRVVVPAMEAFAKALELVVDNLDTLAVALGLLAARQIPALVRGVVSMIGYLTTMEGLFIAGATASRALAVAMSAIPFAAAVAVITGVINGFQESRRAAAAYADALKLTTAAQEDFNAAVSALGENYTVDAAKAAKNAAEALVSSLESSLEKAQQALDAEKFFTSAFGVELFDTATTVKLKQEIADLQQRLGIARSAVDAYATRIDVMEEAAANAAPTVRELAQATQEAGKQAYQSVPSVSALKDEYGNLAFQARDLIKAQNELAIANAEIGFSNAIAEASTLIDSLGLSVEKVNELNTRLVEIKGIEGYAAQARAAKELADEIVNAAREAGTLDGNTIKVAESLYNASQTALDLAKNTGDADVRAGQLAQKLTEVWQALSTGDKNSRALATGILGAVKAATALYNVIASVGRALASIGSALSAVSKVSPLFSTLSKAGGAVGGVIGKLVDSTGIQQTLSQLGDLGKQLSAIPAIPDAPGGGGSKGGGGSADKSSALADAVKRLTDNYKEQAATLGLTRREMEEYQIRQELLKAAQKDGVALSEEVVQSVLAQRDAYEEAARAADTFAVGAKQGWDDYVNTVQTNAEFARSLTQNMFTGVADTIANFVKTGKLSFRDLIADLLGQIAQFLANRLVIDFLGINGNFGGGTGGLGTMDFIGSLFGGARALGGSVDPSKAYLVGENGPELFTPNAAGSIASASQTASMGGGTTHNEFHFHITTPDVNGFRRSQGQIEAQMARALQRADQRNN